ncbi:MAG TPA: hypothetical protein VIG67_06920 [Yaniella sp.]
MSSNEMLVDYPTGNIPYPATQDTRISRDAGIGAVLGREIMAKVWLIRNDTFSEDSPVYPR